MNAAKLGLAIAFVAVAGALVVVASCAIDLAALLHRGGRKLQEARAELRRSTPRDLELERQERAAIVREWEAKQLRARASGERRGVEVDKVDVEHLVPAEHAVECDRFGAPRVLPEPRGIVIRGPWRRRTGEHDRCGA